MFHAVGEQVELTQAVDQVEGIVGGVPGGGHPGRGLVDEALSALPDLLVDVRDVVKHPVVVGALPGGDLVVGVGCTGRWPDGCHDTPTLGIGYPTRLRLPNRFIAHDPLVFALSGGHLGFGSRDVK